MSLTCLIDWDDGHGSYRAWDEESTMHQFDRDPAAAALKLFTLRQQLKQPSGNT